MVDARLLSGVEVLVAVIKTGSFVRAGEVVGLSNSGVSRAIARLEKRLGVRLIERTTRSLRLTEEGARFHAEAAPLLARLGEAATALTDGAAAVRGRLRAEMDPFFSRLVFAPQLERFLSRYPSSNSIWSPPTCPATSSRMALIARSVSASRLRRG